MIPKALRDRLGMRRGAARVGTDDRGSRFEPSGVEGLERRGGRLVIPSSGAVLDDDVVRMLRDADQK